MSEGCKWCVNSEKRPPRTFVNEVIKGAGPIQIGSFSQAIAISQHKNWAILQTDFAVTSKDDPQGITSYASALLINYCPMCGRLLHQGKQVTHTKFDIDARYANLGTEGGETE